jgi:predicted nucleic acid-binding protein
MAVLVLDAGVLIAHERGDRSPEAWLDRAAREGIDVAVAAPTITEVWRNGARQARVARLLNVCRIIDCDQQLARAGGEIMGRAQSRETLDAIVVATAALVGGVVLTDDLADLGPLGAAAGVRVVSLRSAAG